jgi:prepilin-type N-terminal cleavage/methylation domain-containing protein
MSHSLVRRLRSQRGYTLQESLVSAAVLGILAAGVFGMIQDSEKLLDLSLRTGKVRELGTEITRDLHHELGQARAASVTIDTRAVTHDEVAYRVPLQVTAGTVDWGAIQFTDPPTPLSNHTCHLLVRQKGLDYELVRRILDPAGAPVGADSVLLRGLDPPVAGNKSMTVTLSGRLLTIQVRLRRRSDDPNSAGDTIKTHSTTVRLRN